MISKKSIFRTYLMLVMFCLLASPAWAIEPPKDLRGTEVGQSLVKWEWNRVPGAVNYEVTVDGQRVGLTRDPQLYSGKLWAGDHSITVRTVNSSGAYSSRTDTVKIRVSSQFSSGAANKSYVVGEGSASTSAVAAAPPVANANGSFQPPQGSRGTEISGKTVRWEWNAVSGASRYEVTVDGAYAGNSNNTQFTSNNLWVGEHSMTVKAVDANGRLSVQSDTIKVNVTGQGSSATVSQNSNSESPAPTGDSNAANVRSFIDPASYNYSEVNQKSGYELIFSDEFNGTALNPYRWHTQLRWDGEYNGERYEYRVINGEDQFYVNLFSSDQAHKDKIVPKYNPFQFNGSRLAIRATRNPLKTNNNKRAFGNLSEMSSQQNFLSGALSTHGKFSQKYGYFEARIKIPSHVGTFPAFWLFHEKRAWEGTQRTEIDIMENLGHAPWYVYNSFHYYKNVTATYRGEPNFLRPRPNGQIYTGTDYAQEYHVYAVEWKPGQITWFIDGQQVSVLHHGEVNHEELFLMINLAMGGNWTNYPTNSGGLGRAANDRFPTQNDLNNFGDPALEIDYVRVYKRR